MIMTCNGFFQVFLSSVILQRKALVLQPMMDRLWMWRSLQTLALTARSIHITWHPSWKALSQACWEGQPCHRDAGAIRYRITHHCPLVLESHHNRRLRGCQRSFRAVQLSCSKKRLFLRGIGESDTQMIYLLFIAFYGETCETFLIRHDWIGGHCRHAR